MRMRKLRRSAADDIFWYEAPRTVLDDSAPPFYRWYPDGVTNAWKSALVYRATGEPKYLDHLLSRYRTAEKIPCNIVVTGRKDSDDGSA